MTLRAARPNVGRPSPAALAPRARHVAPADAWAFAARHGCHGHGLSGGRVAGPPDLPPGSNLTTAGLGGWSEADFVRAMRTGRRPDGRALDEFMPCRVLGRMTDEELHAPWLYLRGVPPRAFGST